MSDLPDYKKISFPDMPPIPLEEVVPGCPPEVYKYMNNYIYNALFKKYKEANQREANRCIAKKGITNTCINKPIRTCDPKVLNNMHIFFFNLLCIYYECLQALDLLKSFLVYYSKKRISANEVSHHSIITACIICIVVFVFVLTGIG